MLETSDGYMFAHYAKSKRRKRGDSQYLATKRCMLIMGEDRNPYQSAISHEIRELFVLSLVDLRLEDAESHWLFDDIVIIRHITLVDTAME